MQRSTSRIVVACLLLILGIAAVYMPNRTGRETDSPDQQYVADLDFWQRTDREQHVVATASFDLAHSLEQIPLTLGDWQGQDVPQTNVEVFILLDPEQYVQRLYRDSKGHYVWLSLIGGRTSRSFHPPDLCYDADGWQTVLSSQSIPLSEGETINGLWLEARKQVSAQEVQEHLAFYFYLFPDSRRNHEDGIVLFKLTSPRYGSTEETLAIQGDLLRHLFTSATPSDA